MNCSASCVVIKRQDDTMERSLAMVVKDSSEEQFVVPTNTHAVSTAIATLINIIGRYVDRVVICDASMQE